MEEWKDIPGYPGYQVSSLGKVKSFRRGKARILKPGITKDGYHKVSLRINGATKRFYIHQLVMMAFEGFIPAGRGIVIDHINEDKLDNRLDNLQLVPFRFNISKQFKRDLPTGVWQHRNKFVAKIKIKDTQHYLGIFDTAEEAGEAYQKALPSSTPAK